MGWMINWASTKHFASVKELASALGFVFEAKKQEASKESPSQEGVAEDTFVDEAHCPFKRKKLLW